MLDRVHAFIFTESVSSQFGETCRPRVVLLDIALEQFYAVMWPADGDADPVSASTLKALLDNFKADKLPYVQF